MKYLVIDVESIGLHGEPFAVGWVVVDETGAELESGCLSVPPEIAHGEDANREWVAKNCPAIPANCISIEAMLSEFWAVWKRIKAEGALMFAECAWPVEGKFLSMCVGVNWPEKEWEGPYPLHDVASVMFAKGMDPMATYPRTESELPAHHPLADARQSARLLIEALKM